MRFISNQSTGKLGAHLTVRLAQAGFHVYVLQGKGAVRPRMGKLHKKNVTLVEVDTVSSVLREAKRYLSRTQPRAIFHSMAVLDYEPEASRDEKIPSGMREWVVRLKPTPKVIRSLREWAPNSLLISFKLESGLSEEELLLRAIRAMKKAGSDMVVANDLTRIRGNLHPAMVLDKNGVILARPRTKKEIVTALLEHLK